MVRKGKKRIIGIILILLTIVCIPRYFSNSISTKSTVRQYSVQNTNENVVYLSDIDYMPKYSQSGWKSFYFDQAGDGTKIAIRYENGEWEFDKGVWAHAQSTLVYDLENYSKYTKFTAFIGLNRTAGGNSNGVYFKIYLSNDLNNWGNPVWESGLKKGTDNADLVNIDISNYRYLKLYADMNGSNGSDHSVYADAKLTTADYKETDYEIKTVADYDKEIAAISNKDLTTNKEYEKLVLQRYLVKEFGEYGLKKFLSESEENRTTYKWLTDNVDTLRMYIMGGRPDGSYYNSLTVLKNLLNAKLKDGHQLIDDFNNQELTKYKTMTMGNLYKKMAITLSLTHSTLVGLWMNPNVIENQSDAVTRYEIYKWLYNNDKFKVSEKLDQTKWFETLEIEEMRYVMNNIIDDEEIIWLNEYTQNIIDAHPTETEKYLTPHPYMKYIDPNYSKPEYYDPNMLPHWDDLYGHFNSVYKVTYKTGVQKLWMNLDNGAVCGGISKIGSNIRGVHGTPSSVINQPGHAALIYWRENANGEGYWTIDNDVSDWKQSNKTEKLSVRMPLGWGDQDYLKTTSVSEGVVNYVLLAQAALNDYANYEKSRELYITADLETTSQKKIETYEKSLQALNINVDAWYGIIEEYDFALVQRIFTALKYYPLPMYHLSEEILDRVTNVETKYEIIQLRTSVLEDASDTKNTEHIQDYAIRVEANYLLGKIDTSLATFSFDGENANKIVLAENYQNARWDYCLDGEACKPEDRSKKNDNWKEITNSASAALNSTEINKINEANDIYVHVVGVNYTDTNLYKIDIQKPELPALYANDLENRVIGVDNLMEWRITKDEAGNRSDIWTSFEKESPILTGEKTVEIRRKATGTSLTSESSTFTFTTDSVDKVHQYIPASKYSIFKVSSEATGQKRFATNAIDGNLNTSWHSDWNGKDKTKEIIIQLNHNYYISGLDYVPIPQDGNGGNGLIWRAKIEISEDGENWKTITPTLNKYVNEWDPEEPLVIWENTELYKNSQVWRHVDFTPEFGRYVKITGVKTNPLTNGLSFMTASMFNLYQDATQYIEPSLELAYSTLAPTNQSVTVRVVNQEENIEIDAVCLDKEDESTCLTREKVIEMIKNHDSEEELTDEQLKMVEEMLQTHVFETNGSVYFKFHETDKEPITYYYEEATVTNIDTTAPVAHISYTKESATNQDVIAILEADEPIKAHTGVPVTYEIGENGENNFINIPPEEVDTYIAEHKTVHYIYTFEENGSFTFEYEDLAGNIGSAVATVSWIDREVPFAAIQYSTNEKTHEIVTATLIPEEGEEIIVLNNNANRTYAFDKNGVNRETATVDWIVEKPQEENQNTEETPNTQENTTTNSSVQTDSQDKQSSSTKQNNVYKQESTNQNGNTTIEEVPYNSITIEDTPEQSTEEKKENREEAEKTEEKSQDLVEKKNSMIPILTIGTLSIASLTTCGIIIRKRRA